MTSTTISTATTTKLTLEPGDSLNVTWTGAIITSKNAVAVDSPQTSGVTISNSGTIESTGSGNRAIAISGPSQSAARVAPWPRKPPLERLAVLR